MRSTVVLSFLLLLLVSPGLRGAENVILSEILARNQDTLQDGNGRASDWIELFNAGAEAVDLGGWYLTDDPADLKKWMFPNRLLGREQFLVVFASGLGVPDPAGNLHVNFQLADGGEYLALVKPDGVTIASEFSPAFPPQFKDVSYGLPQTRFTNRLVTAGAPARFHVPGPADDGTIGLGWTGGAEPFDDSSWVSVTNAIGFDSTGVSVSTNILVNIARGRAVLAAAETWNGLPKENLTDGDLTTFSHNLTPVADYWFMVDLGGTYRLENIEVFNRADPCCPERLSNYTVSLLSDAGPEPGPVVWSAGIRINGSNSGVGGRDLITPNLDPTGVFAGRWLMVQSRASSGDRFFQVAEIRANAANWARGATVLAAGPTAAGAPPENIVDGDPATFSSSLEPSAGFAYQVRLTNFVVLQQLEIFNRADGCCPDRLSNYRVSVHPDVGGNMGPAVWSADVRSDRSDSGVGGRDVLTAGLDPAGVFEGQWIQIQNLDAGSLRDLQLAELRVLGFGGNSGYAPLVRRDVGTEMKGQSAAAWLRVPFVVQDTNSQNHALLRLRYDDGFVAYLNGVEVARDHAPTGAPAFGDAATGAHSGTAIDEFVIDAGLLRPGTNILAIRALNVTAADRDFLIFPELTVTRTDLGAPGYELLPTPGALNPTNTVAGFAEDPRFSVDRGFFETPFDVVITSPTPGATLVYTTNSSIPSLTNGVVLPPVDPDATVAATVRVATTTVLRAAAFKSGLQRSRIDTHTYLFLRDVVNQPPNPPGFPTSWNGTIADYAMDRRVVTNAAYRTEILDDLRSIRTLSIVMNPADLFGAANGIYTFSESVGDAWERAASIELINPDGTTAFQEDCGARIWGTGWRPHSASLKHSFQLKFKKEYGAGKLHYPLFPGTTVTEFDNMVLRAQGSRSWNDFRVPDIEQSQYIHDAWARDTGRAMGRTDGHATYVHLYLNGLYWGLYNPVEKTDENFSAKYYGGEPVDYDVVTRRVSAAEVDAGDLAAWTAMMTVINGGVATPERYALVQRYLDVDHFIDYMMLNQYASNHDGPTSNGNNMRASRSRQPGGQFRFHVWDMEYTFWYAQEDNLGVDIDDSAARIFQKLRENPEFRLRFGDHAQRHLFNQGALTPAPAAARWVARANEILGAVVGESARWGDARRPDLPFTRNVEWTNELNRLLTQYFPVRTQIYLDQLKGAGLYPRVAAPSFSRDSGDVLPGETLELDVPVGTIYYTLDGSDPRLSGGAIATGAIGYTPTTLLVTTGSVARVFIPADDALSRTWDGSDPAFDDSSWLTRRQPVGFDVSLPLALVPVPLTNATADFSESGRGVNLAIDKDINGTGWGLYQPDFQNKGRAAVAVFETVSNVGYADGTRLVFSLRHGLASQLGLGRFRLSATTDDRGSFADGRINQGAVVANWVPLRPISAISAGGSTMTLNPDFSILVTGVNPSTDLYTVTVITSLTNITGVRIEAMGDPLLPASGPGRSLGSPVANAVLTDFSVQAAPATLAPLLDPAEAAGLQSAMQSQSASAYLRYPFPVGEGAVFDRLVLRVRYEDGFVAYLNGREAARRNAPANPGWDAAAAADRSKGQTFEFEEIDLTPLIPALTNGNNVLAIHGLNSAKESPDFLIQVELLGKTDGPIELSDSLTVKARTLLDGQWSALSEAAYTARLPLRITEIMYNPPGDGAVLGDEFEFLELKNVGAFVLDVGGLNFTSGITFAFTNRTLLNPGQIIVLARNPARFASRYPGVPVFGVYSGRLDNAGEALTLSRPFAGPRVLSVTYGDALPWPPAADGLGFSIVPRDPAGDADMNLGTSWRASAQSLGSPGADDPDPGIPEIRVNEVLAHTALPQLDSIELYNPSSLSVDIGGWFLSDDRAVPKKFRIPDHRIIEAGGYVVFDERDFDPLPAGTNNFSLSSQGEAVYLFSGDPATTNLTGYIHGFSFGASAAGVSFGRHVISTGEEQFPAQTAVTLPGPNSGPRVGPLVISEIMYHPPPGGDEYVEIRNITGSAVELFDPLRPTNTWRVAGIDYLLPTNLTLAPRGFLLIVPTAPADFRAKYGVGPEVLIVGPYPGQLQDSGERLALEYPDAPTTNGVPYIAMDEVRYNDRAPWPVLADGFGPSLQRLDPNAYGNDPANWRAAAPGLGSDFIGGVAPTIAVQPADQVVVQGRTASFNVSASGTGPLWYQWRFFGTNLPGGTQALLTLTNVGFSQAGPYAVTVYNPAGVAISATATLAVLSLPTVLVPPGAQFIKLGLPATFSVLASGTGTLRYQWQVNGSPIAGATNSSFTIPAVQLSNNGDYRVIVTDDRGSTTSASAPLVVLITPVVLLQPTALSVPAGGNATFSVVVSNSATLPLGFRWRRNGATVGFLSQNQTDNYFTVTNVQAGGSYSVVITNAAAPGGVLSAIVPLTVLADTDRDGLPDGWETDYQLDLNSAADANRDDDGDGLTNLQEYLAGTDPRDAGSYLRVEPHLPREGLPVRFVAVSNRTYTVEWKEDIDHGRWLKLKDVPARTNTHVEIVEDLRPMASGRLYRAVTPRQATASAGPVFLESPLSMVVNAGDRAELAAFAIGTGPLEHQWFLNGKALAGATSSNLVVTTAGLENAGAYSVRATDGSGATTNQQPAILAVRPRITASPEDRTAFVGETVSLSVGAVGSAPLRYRWLHDGKPVVGGTNATLLLPDVRPSDAGSYRVTVSHATGLGTVGVMTAPATLTVSPR